MRLVVLGCWFYAQCLLGCCDCVVVHIDYFAVDIMLVVAGLSVLLVDLQFVLFYRFVIVGILAGLLG